MKSVIVEWLLLQSSCNLCLYDGCSSEVKKEYNIVDFGPCS
jgi:hypothetical protein